MFQKHHTNVTGSDRSKHERDTLSPLSVLGLREASGKINTSVMECFTRLSAGQFLMNFLSSHKIQDIQELNAAFTELSSRQDYKNIYLLLSIQYDQMGLELPDPVWWLSDHPEAVRLFALGFAEQLDRLLGQTTQGGGVDHDQAADGRAG